MWGISYWIVPLFSGAVWLAMLLTMLIHWLTQGSPHYPWMADNQKIAYISDVGASSFGRPVFIAMGTVTVVSFDLAFIAERWLRHRGRLTHNTSFFQKFLSVLSILAAIVGAMGLIILTIYNDKTYPNIHDAFLVVFIAGYIVSAICICWEYQRLGIHFREHRILRMSFWIKLAFILVEVALAIAFGVCRDKEKRNAAAILEWVVALVYAFYVFSFFIDFIPAVHTKHHQSRETAEMAASNDAERGVPMTEAGTDRYGNSYANGHVNGNGYANGNGYTNGYTNGNGAVANGHGYDKPVVPASRNF